MRLVGDVLDKQLIDSRNRRTGRVDGIVLELRVGRPPVVTHLEVGPVTLLRRFSRRLAGWYARWDARLGPGRGAGYRIAVDDVRFERISVHVNRDLSDSPVLALERWVRRAIIGRLPGARR